MLTAPSTRDEVNDKTKHRLPRVLAEQLHDYHGSVQSQSLALAIECQETSIGGLVLLMLLLVTSSRERDASHEQAPAEEKGEALLDDAKRASILKFSSELNAIFSNCNEVSSSSSADMANAEFSSNLVSILEKFVILLSADEIAADTEAAERETVFVVNDIYRYYCWKTLSAAQFESIALYKDFDIEGKLKFLHFILFEKLGAFLGFERFSIPSDPEKLTLTDINNCLEKSPLLGVYGRFISKIITDDVLKPSFLLSNKSQSPQRIPVYDYDKLSGLAQAREWSRSNTDSFKPFPQMVFICGTLKDATGEHVLFQLPSHIVSNDGQRYHYNLFYLPLRKFSVLIAGHIICNPTLERDLFAQRQAFLKQTEGNASDSTPAAASISEEKSGEELVGYKQRSAGFWSIEEAGGHHLRVDSSASLGQGAANPIPSIKK